MTRLEALRQLLAAPRDADQDRIGARVIYAEPDGRQKVSLVFRVLNFTKRKVS